MSLAEVLQDIAHEVSDARKAKGWEHQLGNEVALAIIWGRKWRLLQGQGPGGLGFDVIPHLGGRVGNVAVYADTGAQARLGRYPSRNFGSCPIRPGCGRKDF